jgi:hypothetical protein
MFNMANVYNFLTFHKFICILLCPWGLVTNLHTNTTLLSSVIVNSQLVVNKFLFKKQIQIKYLNPSLGVRVSYLIF